MVGSSSKSGLVHFLLGLLSSRATGQLIGLVAILMIVWFAGGYLGLDTVNKRLFAMGAVAAAFILFIFARWLWTRRSGERLASELAGHNAQSDAEIAEISEKMKQALDSLKASHLGAGYRGSTALYALPWYMIIGPSAAGKSTLFANSGLHFPYSKSNQVHIQGFGGTRNCDWWFSDQAILIDTAGRYTTEESDNAEWLSFLNLLKKYRPKLPINGVLVAISVADILTADSEQVRQHVKLVRERIQELVDQLGVIFPVHILFTKTDLISGFEPFFNDLDAAQREQVWGTYLLDLSEEQENDAAQLFETRMNDLYSRLCEQRISKMAREQNPQRKQLIFDFPNQFLSATEKLTEFVNLLFKENPYQEVPWFAGVYFTSGTQEGTPIETVKSGALAKFRAVLFEHKQETITQAFFINRVFNDVVFRLQGLTRGNRKRRIVQRWLKGITVTAGLGSIAGVAALLMTSFTSNQLLINQGENAVDAVVQARVDSASQSQQLDATLALFAHYQQLLQYEKSLPWHFIFGIYEGDETLPRIEQVLQHQVVQLIGEPLATQNDVLLANFENAWLSEYDDEQRRAARHNYYEAVKLRLMMSSDVDKLDSRFVKAQFVEKFSVLLEIDSTNEEHEKLFAQLDQVFDFYLAKGINTLADDTSPSYWPRRDERITVARSALITQPESDVLYAQLKQQLLQKQKPLTLNAMLDGKNKRILYSDYKIPHLFSADAWQNAVYPHIQKTAERAFSGDWVMGTASDEQTSGEVDKAKTHALAMAIRGHYFNDYAATWFEFIESIEVAKMSSISNASLLMARISATDGPLVDLMAVINRNLRLYDRPELIKQHTAKIDILADKITPAMASLSNIQRTRAPEVEQRFADLRRYASPTGDAKLSDYLQQYLAQLGDFHKDLKTLAASDGDDHVAMEFVQNLLSDAQKDNALQSSWIIVESQIRGLDPTSQNALGKLLKAPILGAVRAIMDDAKQQLNVQWENQVYIAYKDNLRGKYPFNSNGSDAAVEDVSEFLNSQNGTLWRFVNDYLGAFITLRRGKWIEKTWNGVGLGFDDKTLEKLTVANKVTRALFPKNSTELGIKFQMMPIPQKGIRETYFGFSEQSYRYRNEPEEWRKFSWPGEGSIEKARVHGQNNQGKRLSFEATGPWALIKLLSKAQMTWVKGAEFRAVWQLDDKHQEQSINVEMALRSSRNSGIFSKYILNSFSVPKSLFATPTVQVSSLDKPIK